MSRGEQGIKVHWMMIGKVRKIGYLFLLAFWGVSCHSPLTETEREELYAQLRKADSCSRYKMEEQAIQHYFEWLEQAGGKVSPFTLADVYDKMGTLYLYRNLYVDAIGMFRQSAGIYREMGDWKEEALAWRNMGRANLIRHRSDSVSFYYQRAMALAEETGERKLYLELQNEFQFVSSENVLLQGNTRLWLHYLDMLESADASCLIEGSVMSEQPENYEKAESWLLKASESKDLYIRTNAYRKLYDLSKKMGEEVKTALYSDLYIQASDLLEKEYSVSLSIHDLGQSYEKQRMVAENERLKNQQLKRNIYWLLLIVGLCLLLLVGIFLYNREKQKKERELALLMKQIREQEHLIEDLQTCLHESGNVPLRHEALDLLYRLKTEPRYGMVETENEWLQLYAVINRLYGDIVSKLEKCPQLSAQDVRICYLVHARMSNATLGALFNVDVRSVTKSKQRIKKKMGFVADLPLEDYLAK